MRQPEFLPQPSADCDPIQNLRTATTEIRRLQEVGIPGFVIESARYDAESQPINKKFLNNFIDSLPLQIKTEYERGVLWDTSYRCKDPQKVLPALAFLVRHTEYKQQGLHHYTGFVIGERPQAASPQFTDILFAHWNKEQVMVQPGTVVSKRWNNLRDRNLSFLLPSDPRLVSDLYIPETKSYNVPAGITLDSFYFDNQIIGAAKPSKARRLIKRELKNPNEIRFYNHAKRTLRATDFEEYNVIPHLTLLAEAFGVSDNFSLILAERESKLPALTPEQKIFGGLPDDYRKTIESDVPPSLASRYLLNL